MYDIKHKKPCVSLVPNHVQMMASKSKEDLLRVLINLLSSEITWTCGYKEKIVSTCIELVNSAYTVSMETPTCKNLTVIESLLIGTTELKTLHSVVALPCFHRKENGRFDVLMVEIDKNIDATSFSRPRYFSVLFAKALVF